LRGMVREGAPEGLAWVGEGGTPPSANRNGRKIKEERRKRRKKEKKKKKKKTEQHTGDFSTVHLHRVFCFENGKFKS